ncbi:hypothetical protein M0657_000482 [Pyricularia oryzae]|uniref:Uncharacterized protein n=1 Tax=Pyricularia oryzae TaxID=318829 RepID=A0A4P7N0N1_PYROR|nr:hypothetical protein M9X92_000584 [Pyricularia oryzae]KAI7932352.1 hypothetical protein M0657_000482 [Pyricularia oryzae]QBZ55779.1 hypothetical protein PoMZ_00681 [Pyricularia oryzae]
MARHTRRVVPSQPVNWQGPKGGKHKKQYSLPTRFTGPLGTNGVLTHLIKGQVGKSSQPSAQVHASSSDATSINQRI